ncbi:MAG TPA: cache domain-containing protein [Candidatus Tripitaka californicus]|uniref:cache domain-containing protein n=1 Tax=Candidatus Tripitaka californicus TaxID=3367616 RepID=UPI0040298815|nr:HAMP domain-containing protein [Planctomycetota bacterium]
MFNSIKVKLTIIFLLWSLAPLVMLRFIVYPVVHRAFEQMVIQNLTGVGHKQSEFVSSWMKERKNDAALLASDTCIMAFHRCLTDSAEFKRILTQLEFVRDTHGYKDILIIDKEGKVKAGTEKNLVGIYLTEFDFFQEAIKGKVYVSKVTPSTFPALNEFGDREYGVPSLFVSSPVRDEGYNIQGVLALQVDLVTLSNEMRKVKLGETGETYLVDKDGLMITESKFINTIRQMGLIKKRTSLELKVIDPTTGKLTYAAEECVRGKEGYDAKGYLDYRGVRVLGVWHWLSEYGWGVISEIDLEEAYAAPMGMQRQFLVTIFVLAGVLVLVSIYVGRRISVPIIGINEATKRIAAGDFSQRVPVTSTDELGQLAQSFNTMANSLEEKEFVHNFNRIIASSLLTDVFGAVSNEIKKVVDFDRISITRVHEKEQAFFVTFALTRGYTSNELRAGSMSRKVGSMMGDMLATGKPVVVEDTESGRYWSDKILLKEGIRSRLGYPLSFQEEIIGAINFSSKKKGYYTEKHFAILSRIAPQLAIALENARLIEKLKVQKAEV